MATAKILAKVYVSYLTPLAQYVNATANKYPTFAPLVKDATIDMLLFGMIVCAVATVGLLAVLKNFLYPKPGLNEPPIVPHWIPLLGSAIAIAMDPLGFHAKCRKKYGDYYSIIVCGKKMVTCLGPEGNNFLFNAKLNDVSAEDAYRALTVPVFGKGVVYDVHNSVLMEQKRFVKFGLSKENLRAYVPVIVEETRGYFARFDKKIGVEDIYKATAELTIMTASHCLLGEEVRSKLDESFAEIFRDLDGGFIPINFIFEDLPLPSNKLRDKAHVRMRHFFLDIMKYRREMNIKDRADLMQYLIGNCQYKDGRRLSDEEAAHILIALLMAGQHTSSNTTAWSLVYLAQNPELFDKLREEQVEVLGSSDAPITLEAISKMTLLDNVVRESLRLKPPLTNLIRKANRDLAIPGTSYVIPKGAYVQAMPVISQHDEEYFENAEKFDPYRWVQYDSRQKKVSDDDIVDYGWGGIHTSSANSPYLPFGAGRHRCIGEPFAYVQIKTIIATFVRMFDLKLYKDKFPGTDYTTLVVQPKNALVAYTRRE